MQQCGTGIFQNIYGYFPFPQVAYFQYVFDRKSLAQNKSLISYTYVYKQSKHSCMFWYWLLVAFVTLLLFHLDDMFRPIHLDHLQVYKYVGVYHCP